MEAALPTNVALQIDCYCNKSLPDRQTIHVQGLSHWAPANIGPYSQCVQVTEMILSILVWKINSVKILGREDDSVKNTVSFKVR